MEKKTYMAPAATVEVADIEELMLTASGETLNGQIVDDQYDGTVDSRLFDDLFDD